MPDAGYVLSKYLIKNIFLLKLVCSLPFQLLRQQDQAPLSVICGMLIAKDLHSMAFAIVNWGVRQEDVNILVAVKYKKQANAPGKKTTAGTVLRNLGPLLDILKPQHGPGLKNEHFTLRGTHF